MLMVTGNNMYYWIMTTHSKAIVGKRQSYDIILTALFQLETGSLSSFNETSFKVVSITIGYICIKMSL